jgi:hypothetical protein
MPTQKKLLVLGPIAQAVMVLGVLAAAVALYALGDRVQVAALVGALVSRLLFLLPVARGRPGDVAKVVTRTIPPPIPPALPREGEKE